MRLSLVFSLVPLAVSVGALSVTEPKKGVEIDPSTSFDVKWTSVDTDASSFDIYLVNNAVYPPVNKKIASNIKTSSDSYTVDSVDVSAGHGYQIDLMSDATENTGILAQSQQFNVTSSAQSSSTSSTSTSTSTKESSTKGSTTGTMMTTTSTGTSSVTPSGTSTGTSTGTAGMTTTPAASGTPISGSSTSMAANGTSSAAPTASTGAGAALVAHPVVAAGLFAGAVAFAL